MDKAVKVKPNNYERLVRVKAEIERKTGKITSMDEVIEKILDKYEGVRG